MPWWTWLLVAAVAWFGFVVASRHRNRRAQFTVDMPVAGPATLQLTPGDASADDLSLLALCYGSKLRWVLLTEQDCIPETFQGLCKEAIDFWSGPGTDLIDRMPSARRLRADDSFPSAAAGGERFVVALYRTNYRKLRNKAWVHNTLPRPGLIANVPWSFLLVLNAVFTLLKPPDRDALGLALAEWFDRVFGQSPRERSLRGLKMLFEVSLESWLHARASTARQA